MWWIRICAVALVGVLTVTGISLADSGSQIAISSVPVNAEVGETSASTYAITISGYAPRSATAFLFVDYHPCSSTFSAEFRRARKELTRWIVKGTFSKNSSWNSDQRGLDHACAYLLGVKPSGLLAVDRASFEIH